MNRVLPARSKVLAGSLLALALLASGSMQVVKADHDGAAPDRPGRLLSGLHPRRQQVGEGVA